MCDPVQGQSCLSCDRSIVIICLSCDWSIAIGCDHMPAHRSSTRASDPLMLLSPQSKRLLPFQRKDLSRDSIAILSCVKQSHGLMRMRSFVPRPKCTRAYFNAALINAGAFTHSRSPFKNLIHNYNPLLSFPDPHEI